MYNIKYDNIYLLTVGNSIEKKTVYTQQIGTYKYKFKKSGGDTYFTLLVICNTGYVASAPINIGTL